MKPSLQKVLDKLREKGRRGVTFDDFPRGKDVRKRMSELRYLGFHLITSFEPISNGGKRARYFLIKEPKKILTREKH